MDKYYFDKECTINDVTYVPEEGHTKKTYYSAVDFEPAMIDMLVADGILVKSKSKKKKDKGGA